MSLRKVIDSPEDQKERLTRRGQGLESIRNNCNERGSVGERNTGMQKVRGIEKERRG